MRRYLLLFIVSILSISFAAAQQKGGKSIVDDLNTNKEGQGEVRVFQDEFLQGIVGAPHSTDVNDQISARNKSYRIHVFSGNDQNKSKQEAFAKQAQIKRSFPEMPSIVTSDPPVWRLRGGNFDTEEEAKEMLKELRAAFPGFGREMYIVTVGRK